jgi:hypothetical protein
MNPRLVFAALAAAVCSLPLAAQTVNLTLQDVAPTNAITWNYAPDALTESSYVGLLHFTDAGGNNVSTFCIDLAQNVSFGGNYTFQLTPVSDAPITSSSGTPMGAVKADRLSLLYGSVFGSSLANYAPLTTLDTAAKLQGFQLAVWNIVFDATTDWSVTNNTGNFFVSSGDGASLAAVTQANAYLSTVQAEVANGLGARMALIALTDSAAQPGIQDQLLPSGFLESVPEPTTYALLAGCFILAGTLIRRRGPAAA